MTTKNEKIQIINESVSEYFQKKPACNSVTANDLIRNVPKMQKTFDKEGKRLRNLLRELRDKGSIMEDIPSIQMGGSGQNTLWSFVRTCHSSQQQITSIPKYKITNSTSLKGILNSFLQKIGKSPSSLTKTEHTTIASEDETSLLCSDNFIEIGELPQKRNLKEPGLYCIKLKEGATLPSPYNDFVKHHRIIYIGQASTNSSLYKRFWKQELNAQGHGTFFRSIGATLGFLPPSNSLEKGRNYKFSNVDEENIKEWLQNNTIVNCITCNDQNLIDKKEEELIKTYKPLLNISHNPEKLEILSKAREHCVNVARGLE